VKVFIPIICKGWTYQYASIQMLERVRESDHARTVCVIGRWVTSFFSMLYYTHHRCMCMYVLQI